MYVHVPDGAYVTISSAPFLHQSPGDSPRLALPAPAPARPLLRTGVTALMLTIGAFGIYRFGQHTGGAAVARTATVAHEPTSATTGGLAERDSPSAFDARMAQAPRVTPPPGQPAPGGANPFGLHE